ncbi:hypothetical protein Tco_0546593 [Tanacetum coccineum]
MSTYLKHQGSWTFAQLKKLSDEEIKAKYERLVRSIANFVPMGAEVKEVPVTEEPVKEPTAPKKRKLGQSTATEDEKYEKEKEELSLFLIIAFDEHKEVDYEILDQTIMANAESSQGRRRSNVINQVPHDPSKRTMISLDGGRFTATTIRMIIYIFKNMFNGSWTTWNKVNTSARDELWELFKAFFQWEVVADVLVHEVWEASMWKLYPGLMSKARDESIKMVQLVGVEFDGSDFSVLKPYNPKWTESSYWEDMIDRVWNKKSKL